ncbi:MAG: hypothetical protein ACYC66_16470 [Chloroflexota bacterium]
MIEADQAGSWDLDRPLHGSLEWLRGVLSGLSARFGSWRVDEEDEDLMGTADPEVVAALQYLVSILPDDEE